MTPLKPAGRKTVSTKPAPTGKTPPPKQRHTGPPDAFAPAPRPSLAIKLAGQLADQTENLRLYREVFPDGQHPRPGVQVMLVSFKADDRFVTKKLNAAAGNTLVKNDWAVRLESLLRSLDGTLIQGFRVKLLEHFYGMASLALVPEQGAGDADAAAAELATGLQTSASGQLSGFLDAARAAWSVRDTPETRHQVELLDQMVTELTERPASLVSHGLTDVRFDARKGGPVFALMAAVFRARSAAMLEQLTRDGGSERFDAGALLAALKSPDGFAGALGRLQSATVRFGPLTLPVVANDALSTSLGVNPEVLRLLREKASLQADPQVLEDLDTVIQQAALLDFVSFDSNRELAARGTTRLEATAGVQLKLLEHPRSRSALATASAVVAPTSDGVLVGLSGTPSERSFYEQLAGRQHTVFLSVDIKALGATAQGAMIRQAAQLALLTTVQPEDVFFRALAANNEVVQHKAAVFGPIEQKLREAANGQPLSILAFGDEAVFALSDWSPESLEQALQSVGASQGGRLVVTETTANEGETHTQALQRNQLALGASDAGNETLKAVERQRELLRYGFLALPEPQRTVGLAKLSQAVISHVVTRVGDAGVTMLDARTGAAVTQAQLDAELADL